VAGGAGFKVLTFFYDGGAIGGYLADAQQRINGHILYSKKAAEAFSPTGPFSLDIVTSVSYVVSVAADIDGYTYTFDSARVVRTAGENRSASLGAFICIAY
jgi:hypothetical protein